MDDRGLRRLVKMAVEAEQLDHPAAREGRGEVPAATDGSEHLSFARRDRSWWRGRGLWVGGALAAAACLGLGVFLILVQVQFAPPVRVADAGPVGTDATPDVSEPREAATASAGAGAADSPPHRLGASPSQGEAQRTRHEPEDAVLFAVYRGADGSCECVQVNDPDWGAETRLADVSRHELLRAGLQEPCMTVAPEVVVIGVAGRPGMVPSSRQHAETIARRLGDQPLRGRDVASLAYAAMPELPAGTVIVAEKVSIGP